MTERIELADVVRRFGDRYIAKYGHVIMPSQRKALHDIAACQTEALGGRRYQCNDCGKDFWHYHGCRNRSCPKCHGPQIERWLESRQAEVLPCGYFHTVVTVPEELRPIFLKNQKIMYGLLFRTAADEIRRLCLNPKFLGAEPAMLGVLHTWTGQLGHHPHVHFLISAGGVTSDGKSWRSVKNKYLIPAPLLSKAIAIEFRRRLEKKYLSRYVFRIAITNARLISMTETHVTFRYKVRYYGLWHHSRRKQAHRAWLLLILEKPASDKITISELIETLSQLADEASAPMSDDSDTSKPLADMPRCPHCHSASTVLIGEVSRQGSR